jgi:hypothetical protein
MCPVPVEIRRAIRMPGSTVLVLVPMKPPPLTPEVARALRRILLDPGVAENGEAA